MKAPPRLALVVDDNPRVRQLVSLAFASLGLEAISLPDARDAVEQAVRSRPAVIVLDLMLPNMDGLTVMAHLRRHPETTQIPIVLISGHPDASALAGPQVGAPGVVLLPKPFTLAELRAAVGQVIGPASEDVM
jgi:CheY-like chemotaxis protein